MPHASCVTIQGQLTAQEEAQFTAWLLRSLQERPDDFVQGGYVLSDRVTRIDIWTANGSGYIGIYRPVETRPFRARYRRQIWRAIHKHRHRQGNAAFNMVKAAMADAPVTPLSADRPSIARRIVGWLLPHGKPVALLTYQPETPLATEAATVSRPKAAA